jgi:NitT/TauT family transport system permease protein
MPKIVLAPLFFLWFGIALASKVAFSASLVLFVVFFATLAGIREVDENYINNSLVLGAKERDLTLHVLIPAALTWIFTSLRTSLGMALAGAVVAEYLGSTGGIGYRIAFAQAMYDSTGVFAGLVVLTVIVIILDSLIQKVEQRFSVWKPPRG